MSRRVFTVGGLALAGGVGYYMYSAGGDPKLAEKKAEHDAARLSNKIKSELPGSVNEAKTQGKATAQEIGNKFDSAVYSAKDEAQRVADQARKYGSDAEARLEQARRDAGAKMTGAVDKFDNTVEKEASKAKSGISSWFGGK